jgi:hypothetical protein
MIMRPTKSPRIVAKQVIAQVFGLFCCMGLGVLGCQSSGLVDDKQHLRYSSDVLEVIGDPEPVLDHSDETFLIVIDSFVIRSARTPDGRAGISILGSAPIGQEELVRERIRVLAPNTSNLDLASIAPPIQAEKYRGDAQMSMVLLNFDAVLSLASKMNDVAIRDRARMLYVASSNGEPLRFAAIVLPSRVITGSIVFRPESKILLDHVFRNP